jgi:hypothetical protein
MDAKRWMMAGLLALLALGGCTRERLVQPVSAFPTPLVQRMQLTVALEIDEDLRGYRHVEKIGSDNWTLDLGPASADWIGNLLRAAFVTVHSQRSAPEVRLVFRPRIEEVQLALPGAGVSKVYEVWIKYRVAVETPDRRSVADWPLAAYGRYSDSLMLGADDGLARAAQQAMRDATAALLLEIRDPRRIAELLRAPQLQEAS